MFTRSPLMVMPAATAGCGHFAKFSLLNAVQSCRPSLEKERSIWCGKSVFASGGLRILPRAHNFPLGATLRCNGTNGLVRTVLIGEPSGLSHRRKPANAPAAVRAPPPATVVPSGQTPIEVIDVFTAPSMDASVLQILKPSLLKSLTAALPVSQTAK